MKYKNKKTNEPSGANGKSMPSLKNFIPRMGKNTSIRKAADIRFAIASIKDKLSALELHPFGLLE
jgi:hypothetical protein